jgi:hypothetical protein
MASDHTALQDSRHSKQLQPWREGEQPIVKKSEILELLQGQPEDINVEELIYTLWFRRKIEVALASPEEDDLPHEEVERMIDEWLASPGHRKR